jgi:hypothetical protein
MALPDQIPVRYMDDDAGYLSVRPVVKQTFRLPELVDMVVSVVGKDAERVQRILQSGTVIYNGYRYAWNELVANLAEVESLLASFPEDDPNRPFHPKEATGAMLETGGGTQRYVAEISQREASKKKLFASTSPWDVLLESAREFPARYEKYSHARKADLFRASMPYEKGQELLRAMRAAAPGGLRHRWSTLRPPTLVTFICPREGESARARSPGTL